MKTLEFLSTRLTNLQNVVLQILLIFTVSGVTFSVMSTIVDIGPSQPAKSLKSNTMCNAILLKIHSSTLAFLQIYRLG